jgi:hypothetical protein
MLLLTVFREANVLYGAFRFMGDPPMKAGGIFHPTLHYCGGAKFCLIRLVVLRADFRETLFSQPDWWTKFHQHLREIQSDEPGQLMKPRTV